MTTDTLSVETALNGLSRSVASQLESIQALFAKNVENVNEALDQEVEEHNKLIETLEKLEQEKTHLELKLNSQIDAHKEELLELNNEIASLKKTIASLNLKLANYSELKKERDELKSLDPKGMKSRIARLRKTSESQLAENTKLRKDNKKYREENSVLRTTNAKLEVAATEVHNQYQEIKSRMIEHDGDVTQKVFAGKNGLECFIYTFGYPLAFRPTTGSLNVINDFKFHIEIRTNWAINLIVSCSVWGIPFLPSSADLEGHMPENLHGELQQMFTDRMEENHSFLLDRADWARSETLSDVEGISQKHLDLLNNADYYSVFAASHIPEEQLAANVKGLGAAGVKRVREAVRAHVEKWERENWDESLVGRYN